jgi:tetratricopeptide (TPR) repeat protein
MARALEWRYHLFVAEDYAAADTIANSVGHILYRWGHRDRVKALLRESIETLQGVNKAVAQGNLSTILVEEGKLDEALATYESIYQIFEALSSREQMATVLAQISTVYQLKGGIDQAIASRNASLRLCQEIGEETGQSINLNNMSTLYRLKNEYAIALGHSEESETLARKLGNEQTLAVSLTQQGLTLIELALTAQSV